MRKFLLSILLVLLFALTACGSTKDNKSADDNTQAGAEYIGEWKANTVVSVMGDTKTYEVSVIELCNDNSGTYKDKKGTWEYSEESNSIILTLSETKQGLQLEISEIDGFCVLKFYDDIYYRSEDFVAIENE